MTYNLLSFSKSTVKISLRHRINPVLVHILRLNLAIGITPKRN